LQTIGTGRIMMSMRLVDYFFGIRRQLRSPTSARIVADRINEAAGSAFWPLTTGVVGGVLSGHLRLRVKSSFFEYNAKPVLCGRLRELPSGSSMDLSYRAPAWIYPFYLFWYGFLGLIFLMMLGQVGTRNPDLQGEALSTIWVVLILFLIGPIVLHYVGTSRSNEDLECLLDFLAEQADARP
jgi:hypothetical protein